MEAKLHYRDYAILREMVLFPHSSQDQRSDVISQLTDKFVGDCRDLQVHFVVIPRAKNRHSSPNGAKYSIFSSDCMQWERFWGDMCMRISVEFPYLCFETPYTSSFIHVKPTNIQDVPVWVRHCLLPTRITRRGRLDFCRAHHYSLWRIQDPFAPISIKPRTLAPHEVDILIRWQKDQTIHDALEINPATNCPRSMFGGVLSQIAEHTHRLQVVAYRHLQRVPPHLLRSEIADWAESLGDISRQMPYNMNAVVGNALTPQQQYDHQARINKEQEEAEHKVQEEKEEKKFNAQSFSDIDSDSPDSPDSLDSLDSPWPFDNNPPQTENYDTDQKEADSDDELFTNEMFSRLYPPSRADDANIDFKNNNDNDTSVTSLLRRALPQQITGEISDEDNEGDEGDELPHTSDDESTSEKEEQVTLSKPKPKPKLKPVREKTTPHKTRVIRRTAIPQPVFKQTSKKKQPLQTVTSTALRHSASYKSSDPNYRVRTRNRPQNQPE